MPADLTFDDPDLLITNRQGETLPFSRGIMATSLLPTGIPTEEAYRLASLVQGALHRDEAPDHDADELVETACQVLRAEPGGGPIVERWLAWRAARFERVLVSDQLGVATPSPAAFEPVAAAMGDARVCLLDDSAGNVAAARRMGIDARLSPIDQQTRRNT